jgi:hypothetical protein
MKRTLFALLGFVVVVGFSGCRSKPHMDSDKTMFGYMQKEVAKITKKGGMASVGIGESKSTQMALAKAKVEARKNLAQLVQIKIENLEKSFNEEVGEAKGSEMNTVFSSATKQITSQTLHGTVPEMQKYETNDGIVTAYVLMVLHPQLVDESLRNNSAKHLYERFRASKAFEELDKEIKEYEEAQRKGMLNEM